MTEPGIQGVIRPGRPEDIPSLAHVHVESWRTTYRGIVADSYLSGLSQAKCIAKHRRDMAQGDKAYFVADLPGSGIVGFATGGRESGGDARFPGELYAIYLLEEHRRRGLGTRLIRQWAASLRQAGLNAALVWVLADNTPAVAFYRRHGGRLLREQTIEIGGAALKELAFGWDDLEALAQGGSAGTLASVP